MSRFEWILGAVLAVMVVIIGGLLAIFWLQGRPDDSVNNSTTPGRTARGALQTAQPAAERWADDAELINIQSSWSPGSDFASGEADWSLTFYSPEKRATALFTVVDGQASLLSSRQASQAFDPVDPEQWRVDSPAVTTEVLASGGREFIASEGESTLILTLNLADPPTWTAILISQESRRNLGIIINAGSGEVISVQQSE